MIISGLDGCHTFALGKIVLLVQFESDSKKIMQDKPQEAIFGIVYLGKSTAEEIQKEQESVTDGF